MNELKISMKPLKSALLAGHNNELYVLLSATLNSDLLAEKHNRPKLALSFVIDRSGSMSGGRLDEAKIAFRRALNLLKSDDELSLVVYDDQVDQIIDHTTVEKALVNVDELLDQIHPGGSTFLSGGLEKGAQILSSIERTNNVVKRVMLLSDGQANAGVSSISGLSKIAADQFNHHKVSTSTYGIGEGFNEDVMSAIANHGQGKSYFGELAKDLLDPFTRDIDSLANGYAREVKLRLQPRPGVQVSVMNDFLFSQNEYSLPEISFGSKTWAMIKVTIPADQLNHPEPLFTATVSAVEIKNEIKISSYDSFANLDVLSAATYEVVAKDEEVLKILSEVKLVEKRNALKEAALNGDWQTVDRMIAELESEKDQSDWRMNLVRELKSLSRTRNREMFSKEAYYMSKMASEQNMEDDVQLSALSNSAGVSKMAYMDSRRSFIKKSSSRKGDY